MQNDQGKNEFTRGELIELRKMKQAYGRGEQIVRSIRNIFRRAEIRHAVEQVEKEADLTRKHKSSAEVVLAFFAGLTVGGFKALHGFIFPSPKSIEINPDEIKKQ